MSVSTIRRYGAAALVIGALFCALLVATLIWDGQSGSEHQWFVLLIAVPVGIQLFLKRVQIAYHMRNHFLLWLVSASVFLAVALQLGQLSTRSGGSLGDQFRSSFFAWLEGRDLNSETVQHEPSSEGLLSPFPRKGIQPNFAKRVHVL